MNGVQNFINMAANDIAVNNDYMPSRNVNRMYNAPDDTGNGVDYYTASKIKFQYDRE